MLIVPDGALHALNFETLPARRPRAASQSHEPPLLIEDFEVADAPSLAMLSARAAAGRGGAARSLLLIGNATASRAGVPGAAIRGRRNGERHEALRAGCGHLLRGRARLARGLPRRRPDRFSFVHFTAHAAANLESPLDSAVILSGPDAAFKLYARDVAALPLNAELVTVSACRSAGERTYSGEGLVGFAWAFLRGGARRVVAGLWDVDDRSTAELMDRLYARMAAGEPAGKALRAAKLTLLHAAARPPSRTYWAPFELFTLSP